MGEAAEDMLDGTCCQECGEWMPDILAGGEAPGFPRSCAGCKPRDAAAPKRGRRRKRRRGRTPAGTAQGGAP